jgi:hypothetical protein
VGGSRTVRAQVVYRPELDAYDVYLGGGGVNIHFDDEGKRVVQRIRPNDERLPFLRITAEEYSAIKEAVLHKEAPHLAERELLVDAAEDAREVRDRLLVLVEEGWHA